MSTTRRAWLLTISLVFIAIGTHAVAADEDLEKDLNDHVRLLSAPYGVPEKEEVYKEIIVPGETKTHDRNNRSKYEHFFYYYDEDANQFFKSSVTGSGYSDVKDKFSQVIITAQHGGKTFKTAMFLGVNSLGMPDGADYSSLEVLKEQDKRVTKLKGVPVSKEEVINHLRAQVSEPWHYDSSFSAGVSLLQKIRGIMVSEYLDATQKEDRIKEEIANAKASMERSLKLAQKLDKRNYAYGTLEGLRNRIALEQRLIERLGQAFAPETDNSKAATPQKGRGTHGGQPKGR